jgi:hypothetical protein
MTGKSTLAHGCRCTHYRKTYFKMFENFEKIYLDIHLDILCSFTKFREKRIFFVASVKKDKFRCSNIAIYVSIFLVFFTHATQNVFSPQNFMGEHKLFRCTLRIFCIIFFNILK